jgi:hypothetical protein
MTEREHEATSVLSPSPSRGGVGVGGFLPDQDGSHSRHDAFRIPQDLVVPEPQHREAVTMQMGIAGFIGMLAGLPVVLAAIDLDYEPDRQTREVDDQMVDRNLPPEMEAVGLQHTETSPEFSLGVGLAYP